MITQSIQIFDFKENPVRVYGTPEEPLFVAADICRILEHPNVTQVVGRLDEDERTLHSVEGASNKLPVNCVTESGLYSLIFTSRKPQAKEFKRWVTHEVLPALRKSGSYSIDGGGAAGEKALDEELQGASHDPEPDIKWMAVPDVQYWALDIEKWHLRKFIRFGNLIRILARALRIDFRQKMNSEYGPVQVYPKAVFDLALRHLDDDRALPPAGGLTGSITELVKALPKDEWLCMDTMIEAARKLDLYAESAGSNGSAISHAQRIRFGRKLKGWLNVPVSVEGVSLALRKRKTKKQGRQYIVEAA